MSDGQRIATPELPCVVLAPDVVGGLWLDPACAAVFAAWREGRLRPVVNRDLLARYVRLWQALGLPVVQVRRWAWWFTSPLTARFLAEDRSASANALACCANLAIAGGAWAVIHRGAVTVPEVGIRWLRAADYSKVGAD